MFAFPENNIHPQPGYSKRWGWVHVSCFSHDVPWPMGCLTSCWSQLNALICTTSWMQSAFCTRAADSMGCTQQSILCIVFTLSAEIPQLHSLQHPGTKEPPAYPAQTKEQGRELHIKLPQRSCKSYCSISLHGKEEQPSNCSTRWVLRQSLPGESSGGWFKASVTTPAIDGTFPYCPLAKPSTHLFWIQGKPQQVGQSTASTALIWVSPALKGWVAGASQHSGDLWWEP